MAIVWSKEELDRQAKIMRERITIDEASGKKPSRPIIGSHTPGKTYSYQELVIPEGGAEAFFEALSRMNDQFDQPPVSEAATHGNDR